LLHAGGANRVDGGIVGQYSSIAVGHDGLPVISYYGAGIDNLRVAACADVACSTSQISNFTGQGWDNAGLGKFSSLTIDPFGFRSSAAAWKFSE
jgi:hypothetical protein